MHISRTYTNNKAEGASKYYSHLKDPVPQTKPVKQKPVTGKGVGLIPGPSIWDL
jgi:hypothetical protein